MINIITKQNFISGEALQFTIKTDLLFSFSVFCINTQKYYTFNFTNNTWTTSATASTNTVTSLSAYPVLNGFRYAVFTIPTSLIPKPSSFVIFGSDTDTTPNTDEEIVFYGLNIPTNANTVNVYGTLFDAYGNPVVGESLVFSVLNQTTYFDNSQYTSFNAYTQTDNQGFFSLNLNRGYDYVLSIPRLGFSKLLKLTQVPATNSSVEVDFGGLGQC
ncbi:MAG: hypothetical protein QXP88_00545 [Thermoproteota archaeon]